MSSVPAVLSKAPQKTRKEKDKERDKERKLSQSEPNNERLKTVVRRLPPNLPEEVFWQSVQSWVSEDTTVWKTYHLGKLRKRVNKENIPSRAYIAFKTKEQLALFSREYDGHVFRDKTGTESQAVVEFAPYPKIPSEKRKPDSRNATIEKDEDYISFIESLKESANAEHVTLESLIASTQPVPQPKSTPLLEALKAEKSANKDKEAILRNHAHYSQIISPPSRKEDKKKATPAPQPQASKATEGAYANVPSSVVGTGGKKSSKKGQPHVQAPPPIAPIVSTISKNPTEGPVTDPTKPVKAPRPPRVVPQGKGQSNYLSPNSTVGGDGVPSEAPARRSRPVIGLASRQFEAALSGVGGRERRAKGERGKEKESSAPSASKANDPSSEAAPASSSAAVPPSHGPVTTIADKPEPPPSPKRVRTKRGGGNRRSGGGSGDSGGAPPVKISGILQRIDTAPSPAREQGVSERSIDIDVNPSPTSVVGSGNRGAGRRGRGGHMKDKGVASPTVRSGD